MAYQSKTYSLSDEVIAWLGTLKDDYGSVNKGLTVVMMLQDEALPKPIRDGLSNQGRGNQQEGIPIHAQVDRELREQAAFDNRPKNAYCKHCGSRFAGAKFATICPDCKSSGHTLTPAECPSCNEARAI